MPYKLVEHHIVLCKTLKRKRSAKLTVSEVFLSFSRGNVKMSRAALTAVGQVCSVLENSTGFDPSLPLSGLGMELDLAYSSVTWWIIVPTL